MKKVLFWIVFLPIGLWILSIGIAARFFTATEKWTDEWSDKFDRWCFDIDKY
jgi:hypothetical protein